MSWHFAGLIVEDGAVESAASSVAGLGPVVVGKHVGSDGTPIVECWSDCLSFAFHNERWAGLSAGRRALAVYASTDDECFGFRYFEDGRLVRRVDWKGGKELGSGEPLDVESLLGEWRDASSVFTLVRALGFAHHRPRKRRVPRFLRQVA